VDVVRNDLGKTVGKLWCTGKQYSFVNLALGRNMVGKVIVTLLILILLTLILIQSSENQRRGNTYAQRCSVVTFWRKKSTFQIPKTF
jgi:hypothetical protein